MKVRGGGIGWMWWGIWDRLEGRKGERKLCNSTSIKNICKKRNQGKVVTLVKALLCNNRAKRGPDWRSNEKWGGREESREKFSFLFSNFVSFFPLYFHLFLKIGEMSQKNWDICVSHTHFKILRFTKN